MSEASPPKPARCWVTLAGLVLLGISAAGFVATHLVQRLVTGSFDRAQGFVIGWITFPLVIYGLPLALLTLLIGGVVDSRRYARWKKSLKPRAK